MRNLKDILNTSAFSDKQDLQILELLKDKEKYDSYFDYITKNDDEVVKKLAKNRGFIQYCLSKIDDPHSIYTKSFFNLLKYNNDEHFVVNLIDDYTKNLSENYDTSMYQLNLVIRNVGQYQISNKIQKIFDLKQLAVKLTDKEFVKST